VSTDPAGPRLLPDQASAAWLTRPRLRPRFHFGPGSVDAGVGEVGRASGEGDGNSLVLGDARVAPMFGCRLVRITAIKEKNEYTPKGQKPNSESLESHARFLPDHGSGLTNIRPTALARRAQMLSFRARGKAPPQKSQRTAALIGVSASSSLALQTMECQFLSVRSGSAR